MARLTFKKKAKARTLAKLGWQPMRPVEPGENGVLWPPGTTRVFMNNKYVVTIEDGRMTSGGPATCAMVVPHHCGREIFWRDLQRVKNEIFGEESIAVQYFPRKSNLVDSCNVYWLFVYPEGVLPEPY